MSFFDIKIVGKYNHVLIFTIHNYNIKKRGDFSPLNRSIKLVNIDFSCADCFRADSFTIYVTVYIGVRRATP